MSGSSVLLVNPPVTTVPWPPYLDIMISGLKPNEYFSWPLEPLGLLSIKSHAAANGVAVELIDGIVERHLSSSETFARISKAAETHGSPAVIGFSSMIAFLQNIEIATWCKQKWPDVITVFGHDYAALNWQRILKQYDVVDVVSLGEGEQVFTEVARAVLAGEPQQGIAGTAWRDSSGAIKSALGEPLDLDRLPWPARDCYVTLQPMGFAPAVFSTRGCPFRCVYCTTGAVSASMKEGGYRSKSIENLVDEIEYLKRRFDIPFVTIVDDLFVGPSQSSKKRAEQFGREMLRRHVDVKFMFDTRADSIEDDLFKLLYEAGLRRVIIGLETGDAEQLERLGKGYAKTFSVRDNLRRLMDIGIDIVPGILAFHPTVKPREVRETLDLLDFVGYKNPAIMLNKVVAYPGTALYREYEKSGYLKSTWPLGEWEFQDPAAKIVYERLAQELKRTDASTARKLILDCIGEWESGALTSAPASA